MAPNIVAIGGGDVRGGTTAPFDRELIRLSGKTNPHVLFIPTASSDSEEYVQAVTEGYGRLGCPVTALRLMAEDVDIVVAKQAIEMANLIYVGGGNTKMMVARWRELGIDMALRDFIDSGRPVGGVSAGAICWFRVGNSDWPQYEGIPGVNTASLDCLGIVDLVACPHTRFEPFRMEDFAQMMRDFPGAGVGIDDLCALQIRGDEYRVLSAEPESMAHLFYSVGGEVTVSDLPAHDEFRPLSNLRKGFR